MLPRSVLTPTCRLHTPRLPFPCALYTSEFCRYLRTALPRERDVVCCNTVWFKRFAATRTSAHHGPFCAVGPAAFVDYGVTRHYPARGAAAFSRRREGHTYLYRAAFRFVAYTPTLAPYCAHSPTYYHTYLLPTLLHCPRALLPRCRPVYSRSP